MDPLTKLENQMQHEMYKQIRLYFSATAIALNQGWGWKHDRINKLLKETQKAWNECGKDNSKSMVELLEDETGVELQNGQGKSWREYAFLNNSHPLNSRQLSRQQIYFMRRQQMTWIGSLVLACILLGIHRREGFGSERIQRLYDQIIEIGEASKWSIEKLDSKLMELVGLSINDDFLKGAER